MYSLSSTDTLSDLDTGQQMLMRAKLSRHVDACRYKLSSPCMQTCAENRLVIGTKGSHSALHASHHTHIHAQLTKQALRHMQVHAQLLNTSQQMQAHLELSLSTERCKNTLSSQIQAYTCRLTLRAGRGTTAIQILATTQTCLQKVSRLAESSCSAASNNHEVSYMRN